MIKVILVFSIFFNVVNASDNFLDKKLTPKWAKSEKPHFRSGINFFSLGAFTGYPVLPGVSAPASDGDREYREKQMIIAMVAHSSSEQQLQTQSDCGCCMHAWYFSFFRAHTNICLPVLEPWKFKFLIDKVVQGLCTVAVHGPNTCPTLEGIRLEQTMPFADHPVD